jgi:Ergosterol biosynthesis ERG4/ERG24 family
MSEWGVLWTWEPTDALVVAAWYVVVLFFHAALPAGPLVEGYVMRDALWPRRYRLNALSAHAYTLVVAASAVAAAPAGGARDAVATYLARHFPGCAASACALGLAVSAALYVRGRRQAQDTARRAATVDDPAPADPAQQAPRNGWEDFYFGLEFNVGGPRGLDAKMFAYLAGE